MAGKVYGRNSESVVVGTASLIRTSTGVSVERLVDGVDMDENPVVDTNTGDTRHDPSVAMEVFREDPEAAMYLYGNLEDELSGGYGL